MQTQAQLMHYIATALNNMVKEEEIERHHRALERIDEERNALRQESLNIREQLKELDASINAQKMEAYKKLIGAKIKHYKWIETHKENKSNNNPASSTTGSTSSSSIHTLQ